MQDEDEYEDDDRFVQHVYPTGGPAARPDHKTAGLDCWCNPTYELACVICFGNKKLLAEHQCCKPGGFRVVDRAEFEDSTLSGIVVHNKVDPP